MAERLVLHIGSMKSGTSFIQHVLDQRRDTLHELGFDFSGRRWRRQVSAVLELIESGGKGQPPLPADGAWRSLVDDVDAWPGTALVSMEFLGPRGRAKIELIQESFPDTELQVVLTARDLTRQLPAMWQEAVQNRSAATWPEYVDAVRRRPRRSGPGSNFWKQQAVDEIARRWSGLVGREHFTLVTVPPPGAPPNLLWERFATVVGLPHDLAQLEGARSNPSIGTASAMVMRALNERLEPDELPRNDYMRVVKAGLAKRGLVRRQEPKLGLDEAWLHKRARTQIANLRELDLRVEGDLEDLAPRSVPGVHTDDVTTEQQLEAAVEGLAFLVHRQVEQERDVARLERQLRRARRRLGERPEERAGTDDADPGGTDETAEDDDDD
jgi:hypothetical protein